MSDDEKSIKTHAAASLEPKPAPANPPHGEPEPGTLYPGDRAADESKGGES